MQKELLYYVQEKLKEVGCENLPVSQMYSDEEVHIVLKGIKEDKAISILQAFSIGFANGIIHERKTKKIVE